MGRTGCILVLLMGCAAPNGGGSADSSAPRDELGPGPVASPTGGVHVNAPGGPAAATAADTALAQSAQSAVNDAAIADMVPASHSPAAPVAASIHAWQQNMLAGLGMAPDPGRFNDILRVVACTVSVAGCTGDANGLHTLDANMVFTNSACSGAQKIAGTTHISATWLQSAGQDDASRIVVAQENSIRTLLGGDHVEVSAYDPNVRYTYRLMSSGAAISGRTSVTLLINQRRIRRAPPGNAVFTHEITTAAPVLMQSTFVVANDVALPQTRTILSGSVDVHHAEAHFTARHDFCEVVHDLTGNCACPQAGTIVQSVWLDDDHADAPGGYKRIYQFNGCGSAVVSTRESTLSQTPEGDVNMMWLGCSN